MSDPIDTAPVGRPPQNGIGTTALVMGILQFLCLPVIGAILAVVFGRIGINKARRGEATNGGVATAGFWLGIVGLALSVIGAIVGTILFVVGVNAASESIDPSRNAETGLADGSYVIDDPTGWLRVNDRCSFTGVPVATDTGVAAASSVTIVGEGAAQCNPRIQTGLGDDGINPPAVVYFDVTGGVARITGVDGE